MKKLILKRLLSLLLLIIPSGCCGAQILGPILAGGGSGPLLQYYIAASGNDSNNGLTPATAWQTISKVNAHTCAVGDAFYFHGGDTFSGSLTLACVGTTRHPVTVSSYGSGQATITSGTSDGINLGNSQHVHISNLTWFGCTSSGSGLTLVPCAYNFGIHQIVTATVGGNLQDITVTGSNVSGYWFGIFLDARASASWVGFNNVIISSNNLSNLISNAVAVMGDHSYASGPVNQNSNVSVSNNIITNIPGDPHSGNGGVDGPDKMEASGVDIGSTTGITIQGNYVAHVGGYGGALSGLTLGGSTGLVIHNSRTASLHGNEVGYMACSTKYDGSALDLDQDTQGADVAYNLTYYNGGPAFQLGSYGGLITENNTIHDNVSYNDVRGNTSGSEQGVVRLWGYAQNNTINNNTIFIGAGTVGVPSGVEFETPNGTNDNTGNVFANNIFKTAGGIAAFSVTQLAGAGFGTTHIGTQTIVGNLYDASGASLLISNDTGSSTANVTTLAAWQADGFETVSSVSYGSTGSAALLQNFPLSALVVPSGGFIANGGLPAVANFDPISGSAAIGNGIDLTLVGGSTIVGTQDWHGVTITGSPFNIGAVRTTNSGTTTGYYSTVETITVDHTKVPGGLTAFPVTIAGTYTWAKTTGNGGCATNASGYDIVFSSTNNLDGSRMVPFEVQSWSGTSGAVVYHTPFSLSSSVDTVFYALCGNSAVTTDQSNKHGVWDSNFVQVSHLSEASATTLNDSTVTGNNSTVNQNSTQIAGKFGNATQFVKASSAYAKFPQLAAFSSTHAAYTISEWVLIPSTSDYGILLDGSVDASGHGPSIYSLITTGLAQNYFFNTSSPSGGVAAQGANIANGAWHYVASTHDASTTAKIYVDGNAAVSATCTPANGWGTGGMVLGAGNANLVITPYYSASSEELRISTIDRGANWIATEHNNQNSPSTFYSITP